MDRAELQLSRRKVRDRSIALLLVGAMALMPPVVGVSLIDGTIGGVPAPLVYVFVVWLALIVGTAALSRPLLDTEESSSSTEPPSNAS
jgi:hypothetical protein